MDRATRRAHALLEFEYDNKEHRKIGIEEWMTHRPYVPGHIPEKQISIYILKLVQRKKKKNRKRRKFWSLRKDTC